MKRIFVTTNDTTTTLVAISVTLLVGIFPALRAISEFTNKGRALSQSSFWGQRMSESEGKNKELFASIQKVYIARLIAKEAITAWQKIATSLLVVGSYILILIGAAWMAVVEWPVLVEGIILLLFVAVCSLMYRKSLLYSEVLNQMPLRIKFAYMQNLALPPVPWSFDRVKKWVNLEYGRRSFLFWVHPISAMASIATTAFMVETDSSRVNSLPSIVWVLLLLVFIVSSFAIYMWVPDTYLKNRQLRPQEWSYSGTSGQKYKDNRANGLDGCAEFLIGLFLIGWSLKKR